MANIFAGLNTLLTLAVLLVSVGRWGGRLEGRRGARNPLSTSPSEAIGGNGTPTIGEVSRRLQDVQEEFRADRRNYLPREEANARLEANQREHDDIWGAIKDLRTMDSAVARRIDGLMGQG